MTEPAKQLLDATDLQSGPYELSRHAAYSLLHEIGVRVTPRRLVVLRSRLEQYLGGGDAVAIRRPEQDQDGATG